MLAGQLGVGEGRKSDFLSWSEVESAKTLIAAEIDLISTEKMVNLGLGCIEGRRSKSKPVWMT